MKLLETRVGQRAQAREKKSKVVDEGWDSDRCNNGAIERGSLQYAERLKLTVASLEGTGLKASVQRNERLKGELAILFLSLLLRDYRAER